MDALRRVLERDDRIAYALLFGSTARGTTHAWSDVDVAIGVSRDASLDTREIGALVADLEQAARREIDLVLLHEAPPALAFRVFREGHVIVERDHAAMVDRKARAILQYLDFRPLEQLAVRGALAAASRGR